MNPPPSNFVETGEWSTPATSGSPPPTRQGHVAAVVGSKLFIHGGMVGLEILSDLYCLDLGNAVTRMPVTYP